MAAVNIYPIRNSLYHSHSAHSTKGTIRNSAEFRAEALGLRQATDTAMQTLADEKGVRVAPRLALPAEARHLARVSNPPRGRPLAGRCPCARWFMVNRSGESVREVDL